MLLAGTKGNAVLSSASFATRTWMFERQEAPEALESRAGREEDRLALCASSLPVPVVAPYLTARTVR